MQDQASCSEVSRHTGIPRVAIAAYLLNIVMALALPSMLTVMLMMFLYLRQSGAQPQGFRAYIIGDWMQALHPILVGSWWLWLSLILASNLLFMAWLYRTSKELARSGAHTHYKSPWAITGFLVPFLNFARPYQVVRDVWRAAGGSGRLEETAVTPTPLRLKLWWAFTLALVALNSIAMADSAMARSRMELSPMGLASFLGEATVAAFSIAVIVLVESGLSRVGSGGTEHRQLFGSWPLPAVASGFVLLLVALITLGFYGYASNRMEVLSKVEFVLPPPEVPAPVAQAPSEEVNPRGVPGGVPGGISGDKNGVIGEPAGPDRVHAGRLRVSGSVESGLLTRRVEPVYPPLAKSVRVAGTVTLHVIISKTGKVTHVDLLSGHPLLSQSAIEAVRQWEYKPYVVDGKPVEVETTVVVVFALHS